MFFGITETGNHKPHVPPFGLLPTHCLLPKEELRIFELLGIMTPLSQDRRGVRRYVPTTRDLGEKGPLVAGDRLVPLGDQGYIKSSGFSEGMNGF